MPFPMWNVANNIKMNLMRVVTSKNLLLVVVTGVWYQTMNHLRKHRICNP